MIFKWDLFLIYAHICVCACVWLFQKECIIQPYSTFNLYENGSKAFKPSIFVLQSFSRGIKKLNLVCDLKKYITGIMFYE